ncbi:MAG TPA: NAD-dependent epimerase/dehydratase family protein [Steroidobacteraceae bacterium]|jgi:nucleoside-diphosphate-sugar epimerase
MHVFLTSATGYVGAAVAARLQARGHSVAALARSPDSEERLRAGGIRAVPGDLARADTYRDEAASAEVTVHTAFEYSADGAENLELDRYATRVLVRAGRLLYTSNGYWPLPRREAEHAVLGKASARNAVVRLGMVYGGQGGGTIASLFAAARRSARLPYLRAAAENRWSLIHRDDLAALYVSLVETPVSGMFDAVDGQPLSVRRTVECAASVSGVSASATDDATVASVHAQHTLDVMNRDVALDSTRANELDWSPRYRSFDEGAATAYAEWCAP